jgi:hypothetical protein
MIVAKSSYIVRPRNVEERGQQIMNLTRATTLAFTAFIALTLNACGSGSKGINGSWFAQLMTANVSTPAFAFSANLAQSSGSAVNVTDLAFSPPTPCFAGSTTKTASFTPTATANGRQTGAFQMTIATSSGSNVLKLSGTRSSDGNITGTWTATGLPGCTGTGSFSMHLPIAGLV